jgi:iron complex transport system substrate-binding protein
LEINPVKNRSLTLVAAAAATLLALSGCAATGEDSPSADGATIAHAFGETTVPSDPQRVVTLGWGSTDAALAVGVVPVGIEAQSYGANADGVLPWVAEEIAELDAGEPTVITQGSEEPSYEEIAALKPDLILGVYSGITEEQYDLLSEIAPTVVYPDEAWTTPWRDVVSIVGEALNKSDEADAVLADIDTVIAEKATQHPELEGKTVALVSDFAGTFYVYRAADSRVNFLFGLGLENAPAVDELASGDSTFSYTLSYEELDKLDSDILVSFADTEETAEALLALPAIQAIPAVASGAVASITGVELIASVSPPTALSLTWGLDAYLEKLSAAAKTIG